MLTDTATVTGLLREGYADLIIEPTIRQSTALRSEVARRISTQSHRTHVPIVHDDAAAGWVEEAGVIPETEPDLDDLVVVPSKLAALVPVSREMANDSNPASVGLVGDGLGRRFARLLDAAFFGHVDDPGPAGLESLTDVAEIGTAGTTVTNLDVFATAKTAAWIAGTAITAFVANPIDVEHLAQLKDQDNSSRPLLGTDPAQPTQNLVLGVPLIPCEGVAAGIVWGLPADRVLVVMREDAEVTVSQDWYFNTDKLAVRATLRCGFAFPSPTSIAKVHVA